LAFSVLLSNFSAPPGSALSLSVSPPPDEDEEEVLGVEAGVVAAGALDELVLSLLLEPQPASAISAAVASAATGTAFRRWGRANGVIVVSWSKWHPF
jgi:hypothetical protein